MAGILLSQKLANATNQGSLPHWPAGYCIANNGIIKMLTFNKKMHDPTNEKW